MNEENDPIKNLGEKISREKKIVSEIDPFLNYLKNSENPRERSMIESQLKHLLNKLNESGEEVINSTEKISLTKQLNQESSMPSGSDEEKKEKSEPSFDVNKKPLMPGQDPQNQQAQTSQNNSQMPSQDQQGQNLPKDESGKKSKKVSDKPSHIERMSLERMGDKDKKTVKKKGKKPSSYVKMSSRLFYNFSTSLLKKGMFVDLKRDMIKGNVDFVPAAYISMIFFSTLLSVVFSIFIVIFLLFFNIAATPPFISAVEESVSERLLKTFWIIFALPVGTFLFTYFYPSMERKSLERKIDYELPFATIHMSAISNSMIEPSKIFGILVSTGEYPTLSKELIKLQNEINVYGYDLVTALRHRSYNSPSKKLAELFNGLATTITSGGNLPVFFDKRSQSLLFEHRIDMEKQGKAAETFMDIYISVVIAAPMVLMLLLMMMSISGLGITLSPSMISLMMILVVSLINILFLALLHLRQPDK